jgi:3-oxoacyl-[acyl-carrier-protein] synthase II
MTSPSQVRITGLGVISPLGSSAGEFEMAVLSGRSAIVPWQVNLPGTEQALLIAAPCDFNETEVRTPSRLPADRGTAMALSAASQAWQASGLQANGPEAERIGLFWGCGMAGAHSFDANCKSVYADHKRVRPSAVLTTMPNAAVAEIALLLGIRGHALGYACACASSSVAIGEALRAIRGGWLDVAVVGGHEAMLCPSVMAGWAAMRVMAPAGPQGGLATSACRPFSVDRQGFAIGEGAAALILESDRHAAARGHQSKLFLSGYATNCDAHHVSNPDPQGQFRAMRAALQDAGLNANDIGYLNAHGTATQVGDKAEAESIAMMFGAQGVPVSSTKAVHGHLLGAGGAMELVAALQSLQSGLLPATANLVQPDPAFELDLIMGAPRRAAGLRHVMSNSFAFGGTNAVLVASRLG